MSKKLFICVLACFFSITNFCFAEDLSEVSKDAFIGISNVFSENLNSSQVLGNPIYVGKQTIIPVICKGIGYGFGTNLEKKGESANKTKAKSSQKKEKDRLGLGAGGFAKPVALIFINADGHIKVEKLDEGLVSQLAKHIFPQFARLVKEIVQMKAKKHFSKKIRPFNNKRPIMLKNRMKHFEKMKMHNKGKKFNKDKESDKSEKEQPMK